jgi:hypothetical protein
MSKKVAVVITDSDDETAPIVVARQFGFETTVLHHASAAAITQKADDCILFDWSPSAIKMNTALVREIRSVAASSIHTNWSFVEDAFRTLYGKETRLLRICRQAPPRVRLLLVYGGTR